MLSSIAALLVAATIGAPLPSIDLWPGAAPGSESWTQKERVVPNTPLGTVIFNVVEPTITPFLPDPAKATHTGVIVAPGGYCVALAMDAEGYDVARWFQERGIAAFVLKYRIAEKKQEGVPHVDPDEACKFGIADGMQAVKLVRQHAARFGIAPDRIGFVGFSSGGMIASGALLQKQAEDRPNFTALIYGAPFGAMPPIPAHLPPIFMAWAKDDALARDDMNRFYDALRTAGDMPEAHVFPDGGHGFGVKRQGKSSDRWTDDLLTWLRAKGYAAP